MAAIAGNNGAYGSCGVIGRASSCIGLAVPATGIISAPAENGLGVDGALGVLAIPVTANLLVPPATRVGVVSVANPLAFLAGLGSGRFVGFKGFVINFVLNPVYAITLVGLVSCELSSYPAGGI
jgi:hypothetical protein